MTTKVSLERALAIIAAHGGDAARWPDAERIGVLALAGDAAVSKAVAEAQALDMLLAGWARRDVLVADIDTAALPMQSQQGLRHPLRHPLRWISGGALAAAVVAGLLTLSPMPAGNKAAAPAIIANSSVSSATVKGEAAGHDAAFAYVFTPTMDEDEFT